MRNRYKRHSQSILGLGGLPFFQLCMIPIGAPLELTMQSNQHTQGCCSGFMSDPGMHVASCKVNATRYF